MKTSAEDWNLARAQFAAGKSLSAIARGLEVDRSLVSRRAKHENWAETAVEAQIQIRVRAESMAMGTDTDSDDALESAIQSAAEQSAAVLKRHREEWREHSEQFPLTAIADDFNLGKSAKISAETLSIRQRGERIAWSLDSDYSDLDFSKMTEAELEKLARG